MIKILIGLKKILWTYVIEQLNAEEIVGIFLEKKLQKTNQTEFRIEKVLKKVISYMLSERFMIIHLYS